MTGTAMRPPWLRQRAQILTNGMQPTASYPSPVQPIKVCSPMQVSIGLPAKRRACLAGCAQRRAERSLERVDGRRLPATSVENAFDLDWLWRKEPPHYLESCPV